MGNAEQPGGEPSPPIEGMQLVQGLDEGVLGRFLGVHGIAQHPHGHGIHEVLVPIHQLAHRSRIPVQASGYQVRVVHHRDRGTLGAPPSVT